MLTKAFFERANALPQPAKAQLSDFLEFLEAKYGGSLQPMSNEEYQAFLKDRTSVKPAQKVDLLEFMDYLSDRAGERGLTDKILNRLLS